MLQGSELLTTTSRYLYEESFEVVSQVCGGYIQLVFLAAFHLERLCKAWLTFCLLSVKGKTLCTLCGLFIKIQVQSTVIQLTHTHTHTHDLSSMTKSSEVDEELPSFRLPGSLTKEVRVLVEELAAPQET